MTTVATPQLIKVKMAGIEYGRSPDCLETLLGSCVGVAVWDRSSKLGGLAHVVLPESHGRPGPPGKFADTAVGQLKQQLLSRGAVPGRMTAKIAGGSTMFGQRSERDVGEKNCHAVREALRLLGIRITAEHVGGNQGRIIRFNLRDGSVEVLVARQKVATL